jgi:hypothetical protein
MTNWSLQDHIQCGKEIHRIHSLHSWYVDEFHRKKARLNRKKFKINDVNDDSFYKKHLFYKRKQLTSWYFFRSAMDGLMFKCFANDTECTTDIYYGTSRYTKHVGKCFSDQPTMSQSDKRIILSHNKDYVVLMKKCIQELEFRKYIHCDLNKMKKWCRHIESLDRWNTLRKYVKHIHHKQIVMYWFEISQRQHLSQMIQSDYSSLIN